MYSYKGRWNLESGKVNDINNLIIIKEDRKHNLFLMKYFLRK